MHCKLRSELREAYPFLLFKLSGIFRLASEHVLRAMRRGRETLLTLLEAFVYDPLVEWGGGGGGGGGGRRRRSQRDCRAALAMLAVRAQELRHDLAENTEQFLAALPDVKQAADKWLEENEGLKTVETNLQDCHQQMALIKEIEAYGPNLSTHPLYAISQKYSTYKQAKNAVDDSKKALVKILKDFDTQIESFAAVNEAINGPQLMNWVQEFSGINEDENSPIFENIKDFLTNAGQASMIAQCEQAETELNQSMKQSNVLVRSCLELLSQYVAVSQYYPQTHTEYHRIVLFRKWLATALESRSPEVCRDVSNQVAALANADNANPNSNATQNIITYNYRLQTLSAEATATLSKCYERLQLEGGAEALANAQEAYRDAKANITNWVRTEEGATVALEWVVIGMLCNLNRRYLMLENSAQSAGDCLEDLTSLDGEWFLDDMSLLSMQAVELLSLLPLQSASADDAAIPVAVECVRNANLLIADLVQLNFNYSTIILPEALKKVHSEEPSTMLMISELNAIIVNMTVPLNELMAQLEMHLRYLVMDMESPAVSAQVHAAELRMRYESLLSPGAPGEAQSTGRMLLMGFNGLFAAIELRARELADLLVAPIPPAWRKIDHISEAMHMSAALQNGTLRSVLEDIFLVRRVQTSAEVFAMCAQMAGAFRGGPGVALYDDAALCKPIRRFTAEYVSRCVLGVHSRALASVVCLLLKRARLDVTAEVEQKEIGASWSVSLESLCEKARPPSAAGPAALSAARGVCAGVQAARGALARALAAGRLHATLLERQRGTRQRYHAHCALHSEILGGSQDPSPTLARRSLELSLAVERLAEAKNKAQALVSAAHPRLKWGAGANPALKSTLRSLETSWHQRGALVARLLAAGAALAGHARSAAGQRSRQPRSVRTARQALKHWEKACTLAQKYSLNVSEVEESLMEMLHPEGNIDEQWVHNVSALLRDMISALSSEVVSRKARVQSAGAALRAAGAALQPAVSRRAQLSAELLPALHTLQGLNEGVNPAAEYLSRDKAVLAQLKAVQPAAPDAASVAAAAAAVTALARDIPALAESVLQLASNWHVEVGARRLPRQAALATPRAAAAARNVGGERNAMGAGVWKRVRLKLEGRDPEHAARLTPHEQVDHIISEATSAENLCLMYEGWMAWV